MARTPSLRELQAAFRASILDGADAPLADVIAPGGLAPGQRLQVYRNNTFISLRTVLESAFPVVRRLVGDGFFATAARAFIRTSPPVRPCLDAYGSEFATFLAGYAPAGALPYLPDVARLEWVLVTAAGAPDEPSVASAALATIPPEHYAALRFTLHPSVVLLESAFPIDRIWRANQPDSDAGEVIDLAQGGCRLLIGRDGRGAAAFQNLSAADFTLVAALAAGESLGAAFERAIAQDAGFRGAPLLHRLLSNGFFTGISATEGSAGG